MTAKVYTDAELADLLHIGAEQLHTLRVRQDWPHVRLSRFEFRFTEEQVEQILALRTRGGGEKSREPRIDGQTARSAARNRS